MKIDPQARRVTSIFMVLALLVMAALAWSVSRDNKPATPPQERETASSATKPAL